MLTNSFSQNSVSYNIRDNEYSTSNEGGRLEIGLIRVHC